MNHIQFKSQKITEALNKRLSSECSSAGLLASRLLEEYVFVLDALQADLRLTFTPAELQAIYDACNGWAYDSEDPSILAQGAVWMEIQDLKGLGKKWKIDQERLVTKLQALTRVEHLALIDLLRKFWAQE